MELGLLGYGAIEESGGDEREKAMEEKLRRDEIGRNQGCDQTLK